MGFKELNSCVCVSVRFQLSARLLVKYHYSHDIFYLVYFRWSKDNNKDGIYYSTGTNKIYAVAACEPLFIGQQIKDSEPWRWTNTVRPWNTPVHCIERISYFHCRDKKPRRSLANSQCSHSFQNRVLKRKDNWIFFLILFYF